MLKIKEITLGETHYFDDFVKFKAEAFFSAYK